MQSDVQNMTLMKKPTQISNYNTVVEFRTITLVAAISGYDGRRKKLRIFTFFLVCFLEDMEDSLFIMMIFRKVVYVGRDLGVKVVVEMFTNIYDLKNERNRIIKGKE